MSQQGPAAAGARRRGDEIAPPGGQQGRGPRTGRDAHHEEERKPKMPSTHQLPSQAAPDREGQGPP
eukprot:1220292-Pyramimonas_sp.AAC.1